MKFEFNSIQELKSFLELVNGDKDAIIKGEATQLNKAASELSKAVKQEEKTND